MTGDILAFAGSLIGSAMAVAGAVYVEHYRRNLEAREYQSLLCDALSEFEKALAMFWAQERKWEDGAPDLAASKSSILNILENIKEADDLLEEASRNAKGTFRQRKSLYRLGKALNETEEVFRSEAEVVGKMNVTQHVLDIHFEKVGPAARDVGEAVQNACMEWGVAPVPTRA